MKVIDKTTDTNTAGQVMVRDRGIGIPPEHLPRILDRFYRVDKACTRAESDSGLGLSIVESIMTAHRNYIELTGVPERGQRLS